MTEEDTFEIFKENNLIFEYPIEEDSEMTFEYLKTYNIPGTIFQVIINDTDNYFWIISNDSCDF